MKDDEIENWAAKKIQSSFKQYKYQKTLSKETSTDDGGVVTSKIERPSRPVRSKT